MLPVLVGCEKSGVIRRAFRERGYDAWSNDLLPAEDGSEYHLQGDVLRVVRSRPWGLFVVHPECTALAGSGLHWYHRREGRPALTEEAVEFALECWNAPVPCVWLENPIGYLSRRLRKPDQIVQPWMFGDDASKATCFWHTDNLPNLTVDPAKFFPPRYVCCGAVLDVETVGKYGCPSCNGEKQPRPRWSNQTDSGQNRLGPSETRSAERAETYPGIAAAIAEQIGAAADRVLLRHGVRR